MSAAVAASGWTVAAGLGALGAVLGRARTSVIGGYPLPGALPRPTSSPFLSIPIKFSIFPTNPVGIEGFQCARSDPGVRVGDANPRPARPHSRLAGAGPGRAGWSVLPATDGRSGARGGGRGR